MEQRGVGPLPVADDFWHQFVESGCRERWCDVCILMMRMDDGTMEQMDSGLAINRHANHLWTQREAQKASLRQQAGRPSRGRVASKPTMRRLVMRMVAPRQGEQHVDIGQCNQNPSSSRHWRTLTGSMGGVSSLTIMTGSPLRTVRRTPTRESALRNASPTNSSTVLPCAAAASVARWYSSSSTVNVDMPIPSSLSQPRSS